MATAAIWGDVTVGVANTGANGFRLIADAWYVGVTGDTGVGGGVPAKEVAACRCAAFAPGARLRLKWG